MSNEENLNNPNPEIPDAQQSSDNSDAETVAAAEAEAVNAEANESRSAVTSAQQQVVIRRAPKFSVFIVLGIILGLIVAAILTFSFPEVEGKTNWNQVFGFLFLPGVAIGAALGAVVALILDRRSRSTKRTGQATAEHIQVHDEDNH